MEMSEITFHGIIYYKKGSCSVKIEGIALSSTLRGDHSRDRVIDDIGRTSFHELPLDNPFVLRNAKVRETTRKKYLQ